MNALAKRIARLAASEPPRPRHSHLIVIDGLTRDQAFEAYGRHRIEPDDIVIFQTLVGPKPCPDG